MTNRPTIDEQWLVSEGLADYEVEVTERHLEDALKEVIRDLAECLASDEERWDVDYYRWQLRDLYRARAAFHAEHTVEPGFTDLDRTVDAVELAGDYDPIALAESGDFWPWRSGLTGCKYNGFPIAHYFSWHSVR